MQDPNSKTTLIIAPEEMNKSITEFHTPLGAYISSLGLPMDNILAPQDDRRFIINALHYIVQKLDQPQKEKSHYLTKFTVAISVGLFDGALNYLWDETIKALRKLVSTFDLEYFFSVAEQLSMRAKGLKSEEDLAAIDDHDLLESCRRIGLLSDVNFKRLEHINYMRNHASAAHPNENLVKGAELVAWLTNCLDCAITATADHSLISLRQLLTNIRSHVIPTQDFPTIGQELQKMPQQRLDDLLGTLVGMFCDPRIEYPHLRANIEGIASHVWLSSSVEKKYEVGSKFGIYRKNADVPRKDALERFLGLVGGSSYKDEDSLSAELLAKLGVLRQAHYARNNFYNEAPHAQNLLLSMPTDLRAPKGVKSIFVKTILTCHIGNGLGYREGVDESADVTYQMLIKNFQDQEIFEFIKLFKDPEFTSTLDLDKPHARVKKLAEQLAKQTNNVHLINICEFIARSTWKSDILALDKTFVVLFANLGAVRT